MAVIINILSESMYVDEDIAAWYRYFKDKTIVEWTALRYYHVCMHASFPIIEFVQKGKDLESYLRQMLKNVLPITSVIRISIRYLTWS